MKEQMHPISNTADTEQRIEPHRKDVGGFVNCHLKLSPIADRQLLKVQHLLRQENIKLSKTGVINLLLENLKTEYFLEDLSKILGDKLQVKIAQVFLNSDMNDEDLEILKKMKNKKENK